MDPIVDLLSRLARQEKMTFSRRLPRKMRLVTDVIYWLQETANLKKNAK